MPTLPELTSDDAAAHLLVVLEVPEHVSARDEAEQPSIVVDDVQPARVPCNRRY